MVLEEMQEDKECAQLGTSHTNLPGSFEDMNDLLNVGAQRTFVAALLEIVAFARPIEYA